jgi:hypothetical protein
MGPISSNTCSGREAEERTVLGVLDHRLDLGTVGDDQRILPETGGVLAVERDRQEQAGLHRQEAAVRLGLEEVGEEALGAVAAASSAVRIIAAFE